MSAIQYLSSFVSNGWQALLLAVGVALVTFILEKTVLKKVPEKVFTFLPFALGIVAFAVYRALLLLSPAPFTTELAVTLEGGFTCGCVAILLHVACVQLARKVGERGKADAVYPVAPLLEGYVPEETREAVAQTLEAGARQKTGEALRAFVRTTLLSAAPAATEAELALLSELVAAYLDALPKA